MAWGRPDTLARRVGAPSPINSAQAGMRNGRINGEPLCAKQSGGEVTT